MTAETSRPDQCTTKLCSGEPKWAYWCPDLEDFSRCRNPTDGELDDGDLSPFLCDSCMKRLADSPHYDAERFLRPEEKFITDGGRTVRRYEVADEPMAVSYGPIPNRESAYVLAATTAMGERVEMLFDEQQMYELWTEVKGVPWPEPSHLDEKDRLVRQVLHYANGVDEEMLRDALEVLGGGRRE